MKLLEAAGLIATSARSLPRLALYRPADVGRVLAALAAAERPALLAGGTDLVAGFNEGLRPSALIDLRGVEELHGVAADAEGRLRIGAAVTHGAGSTHPAVLAHAPGFAEAWGLIANPRIRFVASLGGNLMARRTRYEASVLLTAARAGLIFESAEGRVERTPDDLWDARVPERALLTSIHIETATLAAYFYERSMRPLLTLAVALRREGEGLRLSCAVATEYLRPLLLEHAVRGDLAQVARDAKPIAQAVFAQLPASFADPSLTSAYARAAGAALLSRRLAGVAGA